MRHQFNDPIGTQKNASGAIDLCHREAEYLVTEMLRRPARHQRSRFLMGCPICYDALGVRLAMSSSADARVRAIYQRPFPVNAIHACSWSQLLYDARRNGNSNLLGCDGPTAGPLLMFTSDITSMDTDCQLADINVCTDHVLSAYLTVSADSLFKSLPNVVMLSQELHRSPVLFPEAHNRLKI
eukprot:6096717-Amphidinium_carterae.1